MNAITKEQAQQLTLVAGVGDGKHTACFASARALLDGFDAYNDAGAAYQGHLKMVKKWSAK